MKAQNRKKLKLTPWYLGVNPLRSRSGWYEDGHGFFYWWDGESWFHHPVAGDITYAPYYWRGVQR